MARLALEATPAKKIEIWNRGIRRAQEEEMAKRSIAGRLYPNLQSEIDRRRKEQKPK